MSAFIRQSISGKSTCVQLIEGYDNLDQGAMFLDRRDFIEP
jgi:ABC-type thiamine transport system ATPase subunit